MAFDCDSLNVPSKSPEIETKAQAFKTNFLNAFNNNSTYRVAAIATEKVASDFVHETVQMSPAAQAELLLRAEALLDTNACKNSYQPRINVVTDQNRSVQEVDFMEVNARLNEIPIPIYKRSP